MPDSSLRILITGGAGFVGSHLVRLLLERGYFVRASVRDPSDPKKCNHLTSLPGASDRLELVKAELLEEGSFDQAMKGCVGVFHTASPFFNSGVTDPQAQFIQPALQGTENVLRSAAKTPTVRRVVLTSSMASVAFSGGALPDTHAYTEADWSNDTYLQEKGIWYPLSKTLAEKRAWKFMEDIKPGFDLVVINPTLIIGPLLQPSINASTEYILDYLTGKKLQIPNTSMSFVDVRDVAMAHLICFENLKASGRYLCVAKAERWKEWCDVLREACPTEKGGKVTTDMSNDPAKAPMISDCSKLRALGWNPLSLQQSLVDTVQSLFQLDLFPPK